MSYVYLIGEEQVSLININDGNETVIYKDDPRFKDAIELVRLHKYEEFESMSVKAVVSEYSDIGDDNGISVSIKDGVGEIKFQGTSYRLDSSIVDRMIKMKIDGFDTAPMVKFLTNLYQNPSKTSVDELYLFLEKTNLPITDDGCFIAYKIVRNDYKDCYTGTIDNSVGLVVQMPRFEVDDRRYNTCSSGLHFCSRSYLPSYGTAKRHDDRVLMLKINPADVVSIPSDYNNAKGRCWRYEVVGEVVGGRSKLEYNEFTDKSVVTKTAQPAATKKTVAPKNVVSKFRFNSKTRRWHAADNTMVSRAFVAQANNMSINDVILNENV